MLDMGSKFDPPIYEPAKFYDFRMKTKRVYSNAIARYLETPEFGAQIHVGTHVRYLNATPGAQKKKILIFGDLFSLQRGDALTATLAETARDVAFVWSSNLDWPFIKRVKPDIVIYELVEGATPPFPGAAACSTPGQSSPEWPAGLRRAATCPSSPTQEQQALSNVC